MNAPLNSLIINRVKFSMVIQCYNLTQTQTLTLVWMKLKRFMILSSLIINSDLPSLTTTTDPLHHQGVDYLPWNYWERSSHFRSFIIHLWRKTALTTSKHLYFSPIVARNVFSTWKDLDVLKRVDPCWADLLHDVYSFILKKKRKEMDSISILFLSAWLPFVYVIVEISQK